MINFDFAISQKWLTAKWVFVESHTRQTPFCQWSQKGSWQNGSLIRAAIGKQLFAVIPDFVSVTFIVGIGIMAFYHEPGKS
jgi:hypothetical protein